MKAENNINETISEFDFSNSSICIVKSQYHSSITDMIYDRCIKILKEYNVQKIYNINVSGTYELIYGSTKAVDIIKNLDGIITIGCVIKGDTDHDVYINNSVFTALAKLQVDKNIPVGIGVLTVNNKKQAIKRVDGSKGDKGLEVTEAVLSSIGFRLNTVL